MADSIRVTADQETLDVAPGGAAAAVFTIQNLSAAVGVLSIEVEGIDPGWYTLSAVSVSLFPGDTTTVTLTVTPPRSSAALAKTYPIEVRIISQRDESEQSSITISLAVQPFHSFEADLVPQVVSGKRGAHTINITNTGNIDISFDLEGRDPEGNCQFTFEPQSPNVRPGESLSVAVTVQGKRPLRGDPKTYQYMLTVTPPEGTAPPAMLNGTFEAAPRLPRWVIPTVVVSMVAVVVGVGVWRFVFFEPPVKVEEFVVSPISVSLTEGETTEIAAIARDKDGKIITDKKISWTSNDLNVVRVLSDSSGTVQGIAPGSALITARLVDQEFGQPPSATVIVLPTVVSTDCIRYKPDTVRFSVDNGRLAIQGENIQGEKQIILILNESDDQENAMRLAKRHDARCFIGRDDEEAGGEVEFWTGSSSFEAEIVEPKCVAYVSGNLQTRPLPDGNGKWLLTDGGALQLQLDDNADAQAALELATRHSRQCFISRNLNAAPDSQSFLTQYWE